MFAKSGTLKKFVNKFGIRILLSIFIIIILCICVILATNHPSFPSRGYEDIKKFNDIGIRILCNPTNTILITEDSKVECEIGLASDINYTSAYVQVQLQNLDSYEPIWSCGSSFTDITSRYQMQNCSFNNQLLLNIGNYNFRIIALHAKSGPSSGIEFDDNPELQNVTSLNFNKKLSVVSRVDEENIEQIATNTIYVYLGVLMSLITVCVATLSIITSDNNTKEQLSHSKELQEKEFEFQRKRDSHSQIDLLKALKGELEDIKNDSKGYDEVFKDDLMPLYPIKSIDVGFYSKYLHSEIGNKNTFPLKRLLFKLQDKIYLVNYYLSYCHEAKYNPNYSSVIEENTDKKFSDLIIGAFKPKLKGTKKDLDEKLEEIQNLMNDEWGSIIS